MTFLYLSAFWKVSYRILWLIPPIHAQGAHFPRIANDFLILNSLFSNSAFTTFDSWRKRCVGTLEVTVASLQREWTLLCWSKWLPWIRVCFNWQMHTNLCSLCLPWTISLYFVIWASLSLPVPLPHLPATFLHFWSSQTSALLQPQTCSTAAC